MHILAFMLMFLVGSILVAFDGDFSGLEAIGKFLLGVVMFFVVAWLIISDVYIILLVIGGIILVVNLCKL